MGYNLFGILNAKSFPVFEGEVDDITGVDDSAQ